VLAETHRVIAPDMLNYGKSDKPVDADVSIAAQSRLMVKLLDVLGIPRADMAAHDIGGGVAQLMAVHNGLILQLRKRKIVSQRIERKEGPMRLAYLPAETEPVVFGVHPEVAEHYKVSPSAFPPQATTLDYVVAAAGG